jgi:hypothetical protein
MRSTRLSRAARWAQGSKCNSPAKPHTPYTPRLTAIATEQAKLNPQDRTEIDPTVRNGLSELVTLSHFVRCHCEKSRFCWRLDWRMTCLSRRHEVERGRFKTVSNLLVGDPVTQSRWRGTALTSGSVRRRRYTECACALTAFAVTIHNACAGNRHGRAQ